MLYLQNRKGFAKMAMTHKVCVCVRERERERERERVCVCVRENE